MNKRTVFIIVQNITLASGTERSVINVANMLIGTGRYEVHIISCYSSEGNAYFDAPGILYSHLNLPVTPDSIVGKIKWYGKLIKELKVRLRIADEKSIIIGTTHAFNCILPMLSSRFKKLGWEHTSYDIAPPLSKFIRKKLYHRLDKVIVLTQYDLQKYNTFCDAVQIENTTSMKCDLPAKLENHNILAVGRLEPVKGYDRLLQIASQIFSDSGNRSWKLHIYGEGGQRAMLLEKIVALGLTEFVTIHFNSREIKKVFQESSIYVLTSLYEGLPMVLIEAQTCGLPIVSFDCPTGPAEIIQNGIDGYLIPDNDSQNFVTKLLLLMNDQQLRANFGFAARKSAIRFSAESILPKWEALLSSQL